MISTEIADFLLLGLTRMRPGESELEWHADAEGGRDESTWEGREWERTSSPALATHADHCSRLKSIVLMCARKLLRLGRRRQIAAVGDLVEGSR